MDSLNQTAPDLLHGTVTVGLNSRNTWKTRIEAILVSGNEKAFLATECRAESVLPEGDLVGRRYSEVSVISTTDKDWIIRSGAGIWHPLRLQFSRQLHYGEFQGGTKVTCPEKDIKTLSFALYYDDVSTDGSDHDIFMRVKYIHQGEKFEIVCPCRYTNYATPADTKPKNKKYVQPISGYVLFKHDQKYHQAYVLAHVNEDGNTNCEVVLRVPAFIMDLKQNVGGILTSVLRKLFWPFRSLLQTDEFTHVIKLDADVSFFRYKAK
jgi:hypothetical protein